ncbi:apolipoprotein N-acyltransferase [Litoreibacter ponti]|uniref:Apolipoprotein N-acyltransferase n=1 Tax=Litoreibacter ponti TaxID=1510457 RepID=A0A2T6BM21_9RHOB|nr:apolipoprotein N-acyltransferase [Litoreibacter ponti]PTX57105.1 apolipoprotein N-acyltransferase [Litoreibacter ponti]
MIRRSLRAPVRPGWPLLAQGAALGVLAALGQAPWSLWPVALAGFGGLVWLYSRTTRTGHAAWLGWAGGAGYFALSLFWIIEPFLVDIPRHGWMAPFALLFLAGGLALIWALAFGVARHLGGLWALVALWSAAEMLRAVLFTGFPWASIGHIWADYPMAQLASLGGTPLLTFLTLLISAGPSLQQRVIGTGLSVLVLAAAWGYGALVLGGNLATDTGKTVRLIQPNAPQHQKWDADMIPVFLQRAIDLTAASAPVQPDVIIWPETSIAYPLDASPNTLAGIAQAGGGVPIIVGGNDRVDGNWHNTMLLLNPDGSRGATYYKHHIVPFGEYIPFGELLAHWGIRGLASRDGAGFAPGPGPALIELPGIGTALPLICYELIFPRNLRGLATRPDLILQITNDAWFGEVSGPYQHLAQARLRAIEQGLPLVRAANTGVSAVIDPWGRIMAQTLLGEAAYLDAKLSAPAAATLYAGIGDWPMRGLLMLLLIWQIAARRRNRVDVSGAQG